DLAVYLASEEEPFFAAAPLGGGDLVHLQDLAGGLRPRATAFEPGPRLSSLGAAAASGRERAAFYVVTDLRRVDWGGAELDADAARGLTALRDYGEVTVVDVGMEADGGAAIVDLRGGDRPAYAGAPAAFRAIIRNELPGALEVPARLRLLGPAPGTLPAADVPPVAPGEEGRMPVEVFVDSPGYHALEVALEARDSFPPDDRRFSAFEAVSGLPVLVVEGDPASAGKEGSAYFLRTALDPVRRGPGGIQVELHGTGSGVREDLARYAAVFLCSVASPALWHRPLRRYVEGGGRLVVFLGGQVEAAAWEATLLDPVEGLLPCRIAGTRRAGPEGAFRARAFDFTDPLLRPFAGWEALFGMARFSAFRRIDPLEGARVLARFDDADSSPFMLASRRGRGTTILFATGADDEWTDWPRSEAGRVTYLSLVQWLAEEGRPAARPELNLTGGERFEFPLDPTQFAADATLSGPQGSGDEDAGERPIRARPVDGREGNWFVTEPLRREGVYELALRGLGGGHSVVRFAVNVPERERLLGRASHSLLRAVGTGREAPHLLRHDERTLGALLRRATPRSRYWSTLAAAALLALTCESLLAWLFGSRGGRNLR
ncbi:MAG: hypothetical protein ACYS1C_09475, partial [Planctomycetota bacterium]